MKETGDAIFVAICAHVCRHGLFYLEQLQYNIEGVILSDNKSAKNQKNNIPGNAGRHIAGAGCCVANPYVPALP
jgi:hypothetical protein